VWWLALQAWPALASLHLQLNTLDLLCSGMNALGAFSRVQRLCIAASDAVCGLGWVWVDLGLLPGRLRSLTLRSIVLTGGVPCFAVGGCACQQSAQHTACAQHGCSASVSASANASSSRRALPVAAGEPWGVAAADTADGGSSSSSSRGSSAPPSRRQSRLHRAPSVTLADMQAAAALIDAGTARAQQAPAGGTLPPGGQPQAAVPLAAGEERVPPAADVRLLLPALEVLSLEQCRLHDACLAHLARALPRISCVRAHDVSGACAGITTSAVQVEE
jgi:hypothetical protein